MSGGNASGVEKSQSPSYPPPIIDGEGGALAADRIFLRCSPVGYVCVGLGAPTRLLRFAFEHTGAIDDPSFAAACRRLDKAVALGGTPKARRLGLDIPFGSIDDPALRRLAIATALLKAGFNVGEDRDADGRWTGDGAAALAGTAGAAAASPPAGSLFADLKPIALTGLRALFGSVTAAVAGAVAFLGVAGFATNRSLISSGSLPDHPDISYRYDDGEGSLLLFQNDQQIFSGHPDADGLFHDPEGHVVGRRLDGSVILDPDAVSHLATAAAPAQHPDDDPRAAAAAASAAAGAAAGAEIGTQAQTEASSNEPKLCPDPGPDRPGYKSDRAVVYQAYVSRLVNPDNPLPPGLAVKLWNPVTGKDVYFDECRRSDGTMIEAKGPGYLAKLQENNFIVWRLGILGDFFDQAERQVQAAGKRPIEWHFAEKEVADYVKSRFAGIFPEIEVKWTPMPVDAR